MKNLLTIQEYCEHLEQTNDFPITKSIVRVDIRGRIFMYTAGYCVRKPTKQEIKLTPHIFGYIYKEYRADARLVKIKNDDKHIPTFIDDYLLVLPHQNRFYCPIFYSTEDDKTGKRYISVKHFNNLFQLLDTIDFRLPLTLNEPLDIIDQIRQNKIDWANYDEPLVDFTSFLSIKDKS